VLERLTRETFARCLNTQFQIQDDAAHALALELIEVSETRAHAHNEAFSIVFRGPRETFLPQNTYRLHHDEIGTFDLFIVPIGQDQRGFYYQAVFNRLRGEELA